MNLSENGGGGNRIDTSPMTDAKTKWRRRESNPRPKRSGLKFYIVIPFMILVDSLAKGQAGINQSQVYIRFRF